MWEYTDKVREHFINPRNVGEIANADAIGEVGSLACGDALKLYLRIKDNRIEDAKFQTFGCASAIASSSALTEMVKGKTLEEALALTNKDIAEYLGGLPKEKMHCSVMGQEALEAAIRSYRGEPPVPHTHEGRLVCKCFGVTEDQIVKVIQENKLTTVEEVTNFTKAGGGCGDCIDDIRQILEATLAGTPPGMIGGKPLPAGITDLRPSGRTGQADQAAQAKPATALSNVQRMQKVMAVLEEIIRPRLQQDGGDMELVDIDGQVVSVALRGMCTSCPSSRLTIEGFIQKTLQDQVEPGITVKEVTA
ncbi:Fe-S cluster assembly protein NifU [Desulfovibrio sp. OttesenSCG-928-G15]|nr:Fe-S cluster assembly protein NifU [Desulfovibrio sp. OttesenSCG-928-G15]